MKSSSLGALAALQTAASQRPKSLDLPLDLLTPDPHQPREEFDAEKLEELALSIAESGVVEPLLVRPDPDHEGHYLIIAGERRFRAAQRAGLSEISCNIREDVEAQDIPLLQLVENLQRQDLSALETARGLQRALDLNPKLSQAELARRIGKVPAFVSKHLALLTATGPTRDALEAGLLNSPETTRQFQQLPDSKQVDLVRRKAPITRNLVERELRSIPPSTTPRPATTAAPKLSPASPPPAAAPAPARRGRPARTDPADRRFHIPLTWSQIRRLFERLGLPAPESPDQAYTLLATHLDHDKG